MEFFSSTDLVVPVSQIILLLLCSTLSILFGKFKLALIVNYLFTFYWGFVFNREMLFRMGVDAYGYSTALYLGFGFMVLIFSLVGFYCHDD